MCYIIHNVQSVLDYPSNHNKAMFYISYPSDCNKAQPTQTFCITGFICKVLIFPVYARNHKLANFKLRYVQYTNELFYVAVTQFAIANNITARLKINDPKILRLANKARYTVLSTTS